jgi:hypothetical protein
MASIAVPIIKSIFSWSPPPVRRGERETNRHDHIASYRRRHLNAAAMRWRNSYFIVAIKLVVLVLIILDKGSSIVASLHR